MFKPSDMASTLGEWHVKIGVCWLGSKKLGKGKGTLIITADDVSTGVSDALLAFDDAVCVPALDGITSAERLFLAAMAKDSPIPRRWRYCGSHAQKLSTSTLPESS